MGVVANSYCAPPSPCHPCYHHRLSLRHRASQPWAVPPAFARLRLGLVRPTARLFPLVCATGDGAAAETNPSSSSASPPDIERSSNSRSSSDGYVGLFVRMLGLDNDPLDREQAISTLWKYSQGGKNCIDGIMQFPGCINLVVSLLKSESSCTCEAAAGLLRTVSAVSIYRNVVSESGAIEEIASLLCRPSLTSEVKEQSLCTLWNLSTDENLRVRIANNYLLPMLVKFLGDEEIKVKEAAGGILSNLALSPCIHSLLVEVGVIPKLADLLKNNSEDYKVIRKEAKTALLELSKDEYYRILIIEEGLVRVPVIGASAYKAFRPPTHSWPSLPGGMEIQRSSAPSRYGASELLLGLNIREQSFNLDEAKINAIVGRSQQQFLARIGGIEVDSVRKSQLESSQNQQYNLLSWIDGVARLVLILGLEDVSAITKSAHAIADASVGEDMRISFKEAGALRRLVQLLQHNNEVIQEAVAHALERLSLSHIVLKAIEEEGVLKHFKNILQEPNTSDVLLEKVINILSRIFEARNNIKMEFYDKVNDGSDRTNSDVAVDGSTEVPDPSSRSEVVEREMVTDSSFISRLTEILRTSSPSLQVKVASILEYLVTRETNVAAVTTAGIELGLEAVFEKGCISATSNDMDNQLEQNTVETEEIGLAAAAASRLLAKLLDFDQFYGIIDTRRITFLLRNILKSSVPLHTKDWVAACLVKLESRVDKTSELEYPIEMEVALHETIPRLVEEMSSSFSYQAREAAVKELNKIISRGVMECSKAVAAAGGIFPLVNLIEEARGEALEASLAILAPMDSCTTYSENAAYMIGKRRCLHFHTLPLQMNKRITILQ
ncbi:hypothetical protein OPV22_014703 [Ensete ventricosum]|uniref:Uncharacterized protein n=1 Tax=Ensete ventricosum TaxID=4639 RepID=A0AAV8QYC3_ENSVE|nr:hypothetical protein OPV22_014703 [Ensete ventricosum]